MYQPLLFAPLVNLTVNNAYNHFITPPDTGCPFLGPVYPPPTNIPSSPLWQDAIVRAHDALSALPVQDTTSYAVKIVSLNSHSPLFEHYHRAPHHTHGKDDTRDVDGDSMFRIGSVSKMFTVQALLVQCGFPCLEDPITKYVPELADQYINDVTMDVSWDEITLGALAAQLSGIGRDYALGDIANLAPGLGVNLGLPNISDIDESEIPSCGSNPSIPQCNRSESMKLLLSQPPSFPTFHTPSYSNMAFQLLGYALENITGQTYREALRSLVLEPLRLEHTAVSVPANFTKAVSIPNDPMFRWSLGDETPAGGIYSSTNDLAAHALSIMNHTQLSGSQTRRWLKPHSHTANPLVSVGSPWEIGRVPGLSPYHILDIYTKGGNLDTYTTLYAIIPDLQVAVVANSLTQNSSTNANIFANTALQQTLMPLLQIAKRQALKRFGGTYIDTRPDIESSFTITVDNDIGLVLSQWTSNGTDMLQVIKLINPAGSTIRLFPAALDTNCGPIHKTVFRAVILNPAGQCSSWMLTGSLRYAGRGVDHFIFESDDLHDGRAVAVHLPAFRTRYHRTADVFLVQDEL